MYLFCYTGYYTRYCLNDYRKSTNKENLAVTKINENLIYFLNCNILYIPLLPVIPPCLLLNYWVLCINLGELVQCYMYS